RCTSELVIKDVHNFGGDSARLQAPARIEPSGFFRFHRSRRAQRLQCSLESVTMPAPQLLRRTTMHTSQDNPARDEFKRAVGRLPRQQRLVLLLSYADELSIREI